MYLIKGLGGVFCIFAISVIITLLHCGIFKATHLPGYVFTLFFVYLSHLPSLMFVFIPATAFRRKTTVYFCDDVSSAFGLRCFCAAVRNGVGEKEAVPLRSAQKTVTRL